MPMVADVESELLGMKHKLEALVKRRDQAQWELDGLYKELKSTYGVDTLEEAEAMARDLESKSLELEKELESGLADIRATYAGLLGMADDNN